MNKLLLLALTPLLLLSAIETGSECVKTEYNEYDLVTDDRGREVYTTAEYKYDCNVSYTSKGDCIDFEVTQEDFNVTADINNFAYKTEDFSGGMSTVLSLLKNNANITNLWTGWKGFKVR